MYGWSECFDLRINDKKFGDFPNLDLVWGTIRSEYWKLPDDYESIIQWEIFDVDRFRVASENMPAGLWYSVAETADAFKSWLNIFGWR